jgi:transposase
VESWRVMELNPAHVTAQRRVDGPEGGKTDRVDLAAVAELLQAGRGVPVSVAGESLVELAAWVAHRSRRVQVRTATTNQLLGQLDRTFPGLSVAVSDVLRAKVGPPCWGSVRVGGYAAALGRGRTLRFASCGWWPHGTYSPRRRAPRTSAVVSRSRTG